MWTTTAALLLTYQTVLLGTTLLDPSCTDDCYDCDEEDCCTHEIGVGPVGVWDQNQYKVLLSASGASDCCDNWPAELTMTYDTGCLWTYSENPDSRAGCTGFSSQGFGARLFFELPSSVDITLRITHVLISGGNQNIGVYIFKRACADGPGVFEFESFSNQQGNPPTCSVSAEVTTV